MEFIYCPNPNADEPTILVNGRIGDGGVSGAQFASELYALAEMGKKTITISIASEGGNVFEGYAMNGAMLEVQEKYGVKVITLNTGIAASIAGCFSQAGAHRVMYDYANLMLHDPFTSDGSEDKGLEKIRLSLIKLIAKRSGLPFEKVEFLLGDTSWIEPDEALKLGLIDEIKSSEKVDKELKLEILNRIQSKSMEFLNVISSSKNNKKNTKKMNTEFIKVLNEAGKSFSDNASEDEILNAFKDLVKPVKNEVTAEIKAEDESEMEDACKADMDTEMEDSIKTEGKYNDLKAAYDALMEDNLSMKKAMNEIKEKEHMNEIENSIQDGVKAGKIQASAVDMCRAMAKADLKSFKKFLDLSPVNKKAPKIETRDFKNEEEMVKNQVEIENQTGISFAYAPSLIQAATGKILNDLNTAYNPPVIQK